MHNDRVIGGIDPASTEKAIEFYSAFVQGKLHGTNARTAEMCKMCIRDRSPSVEYRGIFINDEDWGLMPWSNKTYEPSDVKGEIGPRTNERIFELLLRLRANTYWPAMHECTLPFFLTKGNREAAKKYGIFMGASHCEPMACNAAGEWKIRGKGAYDYVNNSPAVYQFWENRVKEVAGQEILYTLGMRGVHDGKMQGAKTVEEQKAVQMCIRDRAGVTGAALALLPDKEERAYFVAAAEKYNVYGIKGYADDGYCSEGVGYYNYGFRAYIPVSYTHLITRNKL